MEYKERRPLALLEKHSTWGRVAVMSSDASTSERTRICARLQCLLLAVPSPWRRVSAVSVRESGRLSAAAADSKLTDSLGA